MTVTLNRQPCPRCNGTGRVQTHIRTGHNGGTGYPCPKYEYHTDDGRWRVESSKGICGYGHQHRWQIIDTTSDLFGEVCVPSLDVARHVIASFSRTDEQVTADVANQTLALLNDLAYDLDTLARQIDYLAAWAGEHDNPDAAEYLGNTALRMVGSLLCDCCVRSTVRDIAQTLPVRGIDYGTT